MNDIGHSEEPSAPQSYASSSTGGVVVLLFWVQETDGELGIIVFG